MFQETLTQTRRRFSAGLLSCMKSVRSIQWFPARTGQDLWPLLFLRENTVACLQLPHGPCGCLEGESCLGPFVTSHREQQGDLVTAQNFIQTLRAATCLHSLMQTFHRKQAWFMDKAGCFTRGAHVLYHCCKTWDLFSKLRTWITCFASWS